MNKFFSPVLALTLTLATLACADDDDSVAVPDNAGADEIESDEPVPPPRDEPDADPIPDDPFVAQLADVTIESTSEGYYITAIDSEHNSIGSLSLVLGDDVVWLTSDYSDGYAIVALDSASFEDVFEHESTLPEDIIRVRAEAVVDLIQAKPQEGAGFWCAVTVGAAVGACAGAAASGGLLLVGCAATSAAATCKCITAWAEKKGKKKCAE